MAIGHKYSMCILFAFTNNCEPKYKHRVDVNIEAYIHTYIILVFGRVPFLRLGSFHNVLCSIKHSIAAVYIALTYIT